ncbi:MAG: penicillin-binding protein 2 [Melioribacter sp.]|nr:penicillin-binding protein 2 [Melioribacter sp.]
MNNYDFGSNKREKIVTLVIIGFILISIIQLFNMQILQNEAYVVKANENSIKPIYQIAPRGVFYDREHKILVGNKPTFTLRITPADYDKRLNPYLEAILNVKPGYIDKILKQTQNYSRYIPRRIAKDVPYDVIAWYEENASKLPGVDYVIETQRDYSYGVMGSHMFGYTKEIPPEILQKRKNEYMMGDEIGYVGIEKSYEDLLRGEKGVKYVLVDSRQKIIGSYEDGKKDKKSIKGCDLILSIDKDAQLAAELAFKDKRGAVVALDPSTGEILAFLSSPQYDLSELAAVTSGEAWKRLNLDENRPLFNRATMSMYSPGSTFKMVSAIAALEEGIIDSNYRSFCGGGFQFGNRFFKCLHVHGSIDLESSIEKSCNTFYYQLALKIGIDRWSKYAKKLGFGKKTGVDISEESAGIVPTKEYYDKEFGKDKWPKGILVSLGIGQGELSVTPIQLAQYAALIANYGKTAKPHFLKGYVETKTGRYVETKPEYIETGISRKTFEIIRRAMFKVVNGAGTATNIRMPDIEIAGKTGTAQNPHGKDHAIFIGFAPYKNPKIAIAVVVENAGFGSVNAAPIARDIIKAYLKKEKINIEKPIYLSKLEIKEARNEN